VPSFWISLIVLGLVAALLVIFPIKKAGKPDEPAPPQVSM